MARALFALLVAIVAATVYFFSKTWLPALGSINDGIDHQLTLNFILLGVMFCATQVALGLFIWKYRSGRDGSGVSHTAAPAAKTELAWLTLATFLFPGLFVVGTLMTWVPGNFARHRLLHGQLPVPVQVHAAQFRWYFHYPGPDGKLGRTRSELIDPTDGNPLGIDHNDPAASDDIVSATLVVPSGRGIAITLHAQDVIHSFFIPALRINQDAVPGQEIELLISANEGTYDIACAQLCGMGHYQMNAKLKVVPESEYQDWLAQQSAAKVAQR